MLKKYHQGFFAVILALGLTVPVALQAQDRDNDQIKAALLNDPLFLSHLRDRLSVETLDDDHIRSVVRRYLLDHPDLLLEMQEVLMANNDSAQAQLQQESARIITENAQFLFNNEHDVVMGNEKGDIKIVEFYDYNCGYCKAAYPAMLTLLEEDRNLSVVMKDFPILGEDSGRAHLVAQAFKKILPQNYSQFHHKMMTWSARATEESALELAATFGVEEQALREAMAEENIQLSLVENAKIAYLLGLNFTPAYIVGDEIIRGASDNAHMRAVIEAQREKRKEQP